MPAPSSPSIVLYAIKLFHTAIWAFFAGCILAIPVFAWWRDFRGVAALTILVFIEIAILLVNRWRCPLTDVAARYTEDRDANFDIYLPLWLARYNKQIFGALFAAALLFALLRWQWP
jgi:hypothetical protein